MIYEQKKGWNKKERKKEYKVYLWEQNHLQKKMENLVKQKWPAGNDSLEDNLVYDQVQWFFLKVMERKKEQDKN